MATTQPTTTPPPNRPLTALYTTLFAALAAAGFYFMRIGSALNDVPADFQHRVDSARLEDGTPLKTHYTGIAAVDAVLPWLVVAFAAGPLGFDEGVRLLQVHFLVNFFAVVCVWNVEAYRKRNVGRLVSFPGTWAFFYQTVAGAAIIPLYHLSHILTPSSSLSTGRALPQGAAKAILPATVLIYLVPTIAMYSIPSANNAPLTQSFVAFWQVSPVLTSGAIYVLSRVLPCSNASKIGQDTKHLTRVYATAALVSAAAHLFVVTTCLTSTSPQVSLKRVFVPDYTTWKDSTTMGLHWIFQWDWWGIYVSTVLWCWVVAGDVQRSLTGSARELRNAVVIGTAAAVLGPGAVQAGVWWWREGKMAEVEEDDGRAKRA